MLPTTIDRTFLTHAETSELRRMLAEAIGITAQAIARVAMIWDELSRRGEDLSAIKFALRDYMRSVATGTLLPEAVALLAGRVRTLNLVADLPVAEQRRLVDGGTIEVVTPDGVVPKTIADLTFPEAARIIRSGQVLSPAEQRLALARMQQSRRRQQLGRPPRVIVDKEAGEVRIGVSRAPVERVLAALRAAGIYPTQEG